ncbi:DUF3658 domain-containing protein [Herbaspirillum rhizosphaerae]|uniref:DUF3658 domain-containing protein n=1 Tax=Herbaspirillum rhizosphaerae TaxID=346179 RepID=A0ABW8Z8S9_9BURK
MTEFHLVSPASTGGSMRMAFPHAQVFCALDDYGLGPLGDESARDAFWRDIGGGYDDEYWKSTSDCFTPWRELHTALAQQPGCPVYIWHSGSGAEYVFLRMACYWLADVEHPLLAVSVPAHEEGLHSTAVWPPERLREFAANAVKISEVQRRTWAQEFAGISARAEMLRECDDIGCLHFRDLNVHDDLLLASCSDQWEIASAVVGAAMVRSNPRNALSDIFLSSRLQCLIDAGLLDVDGERTAMRKYRVRRRSGI